ncbi:MAG: substrate-binding domain-containing protein, partial [Nitrososphaerota archaeon]|nr:substrate-binding domain-containing protein [Nitrososphaerota archaeon]
KDLLITLIILYIVKKKISRREALSTAAKVATGVIVTGVVAGVGGYYAGSAAAPTRATEVRTVTSTVREVSTTTVYQPTTVIKTIPTTVTVGAPPVKPLKIGVIGKSVHPYWSVVEKGSVKAGEELKEAGSDVTVSFWVPYKEDVPAQLKTMDSYIAEGYAGIAVAPSDPDAIVPVIRKALDTGIPVITIDTDAPASDRLAYLGTDNYMAGRAAGEAMLEALKVMGLARPGGKIAIGTGSLTARNSIERIQGFKDVVEPAGYVCLEPVCDYEDAAKALELASATLAANPDLIGAFGVYAYNGPAWARAVEEAGKVGKIAIVEFDATKENIEPIKAGIIYATVAQRQYFMGYYGVKLLVLMNLWKVEPALKFFVPRYPANKIFDTGVDIVKKANLREYYNEIVARGEPVDWTPD